MVLFITGFITGLGFGIKLCQILGDEFIQTIE